MSKIRFLLIGISSGVLFACSVKGALVCPQQIKCTGYTKASCIVPAPWLISSEPIPQINPVLYKFIGADSGVLGVGCTYENIRTETSFDLQAETKNYKADLKTTNKWVAHTGTMGEKYYNCGNQVDFNTVLCPFIVSSN